MTKKLRLLYLKNYHIIDQLKLEEAILRTRQDNWCIINEGSDPSIVMGISGKLEDHINFTTYEKSPIPIIKRYSGGGTVIVDLNTIFISFIFSKNAHNFPCYPERILDWSGKFYQQALPIPEFNLKENDYVIGKYKCGGNAQYIQKSRFVHHTTFLWDYENKYMSYLSHPPKMPSYRENRTHNNFLCKIKDFLPSKQSFIRFIKDALYKQYLVIEENTEARQSILKKPHRKATQYVAVNSKSICG